LGLIFAREASENRHVALENGPPRRRNGLGTQPPTPAFLEKTKDHIGNLAQLWADRSQSSLLALLASTARVPPITVSKRRARREGRHRGLVQSAVAHPRPARFRRRRIGRGRLGYPTTATRPTPRVKSICVSGR